MATPDWITRVAGLGYAVMSAILFTMNGVIVKKVKGVTPLELSFWRCTMQTLWIFPVCWYRQWKGYEASGMLGPLDKSGKPKIIHYIFARAIVGSSAMVCVYQAYARFPIGDTAAITNSNVVWTSLIAYIFLKEHLHWLDMLAIPLTIVGIVFFAQPSFLGFSETNYDSEAYLGMFFAILSSILAASCFNIIRKIGKTAHYTVTVFYYSFTGMFIIGTIIALTTGFTFPCQNDLGYIFYIGPNGILGQSCLTMALQREKAGRVAIARTSQIFFAFLVQVFLIHEPLSFFSVIGAILVFASAIIVAVRKILTTKEPTAPLDIGSNAEEVSLKDENIDKEK